MKHIARKKQYIILTLLTLLIALTPPGDGEIYGSEGDWLNQHVAAAETLRQTIMERETLFPQYVSIGGGSNAYDLAYYGMFRPDVMVSCLMPGVEMKYIISFYSLLCAVAAVNLCFSWLRRKGISDFSAFMGAAVMASAACFFHFHHQIMFVNYMPFLILALMAVDGFLKSGKTLLLTASIFLICVQSFFYAPTCLVVLLIYYFFGADENDSLRSAKTTGGAALAAGLGVGSAAVLLLPTAIDIFSTEKDAGAFTEEGLPLVDLSMEGLLYTSYGCGLTLMVLYAMIISLRNKRRRNLSAALLLAFLLPVVSLALSGFLYSRGKMMIPFLPLSILIFSLAMEDIRAQREKPPIWAAAICAVPALFSEWAPLICAESILILLWAAAEGSRRIPQRYKKAAACCLLIVPVAVSVAANFDEEYVRDDDDSQGLPIVDLLSDTDIDHRYRFEYLSQDIVNSNLLPSGSINKASIYSSVSNSLYGSFYYDEMKNPISIQNRVALLPDANPLFNYFMGIRYVAAAEDDIPYGYEKIAEEGGYAVAENRNVLPMCYGSYGVISEEDYEKLPFPQNLEALIGGEVPAVSTVRSVDAEDPKHIRTGALEGQVMIVTFDVNRADGREVVIEMNGMKNKLSSSKAPYPNRNYTFTYIMPADEDGGEIEGVFSEGDYEIENLRVYVMDMPEAETVMPVSYSELKKNTVFAGSLEMEKDGYFVTSFPYKKGYEITLDGERASAERVNLSFMGFPVEAGYHEIEIRYTAPGFRAGSVITVVSLLLIAVTELIKRRRTKGGKK